METDVATLNDALSKVVFDVDGQPLPIFIYLAHNEQLLRRFNSLGALMRTSTVTLLRHREVIILRMAFRTDCTFEFDQHVELAQSSGVSDDTIHACRQLAARPSDPIDRLLFAVADEIYEDDAVSDETWELANQTWEPGQLLEFTMTAGFFRMAASTINSIGIRTREEW